MRDWLFVALCGLIAAVRIFLFSAAFPFFNNVDERSHFDLINRYAHGDIPHRLEHFSTDSAAIIALYGSPEFLTPRDAVPAGQPPAPIWMLSTDLRAAAIQHGTELWSGQVNHELTQPPLYYAMVGMWDRIAQTFAHDTGRLLYWLRFFNIPFYLLLIAVSYVLARELFPGSRFIQLGVPIILAVYPQDVFYSLNNDVLCAAAGTTAMLLVLRASRHEKPSMPLVIAAGLTMAATMLVKFSNAPLYVFLGVIALANLIRRRQARMIPLLLAAGIPVGIWMLRNFIVTGDLTANAAKIQQLGWTPKPFDEYWIHPIVTPAGFSWFWSELLGAFWRGEICWFGQRLAAPAVDRLYVISSTILLLAGVVATASNFRSSEPPEHRKSAGLCMILFAGFVLFLIYFSIAFDFGNCPYPSRQRPYVTSGRLMLAALAPFLMLWLRGLELVLGWLRLRFLRWPVLLTFAVVAMTSEIAISLDVFASRMNWFHLP